MCHEGEEEDGEWKKMDRRYPGKILRKVDHALPPMKLVQLQREHKGKTVPSEGEYDMNGTFLYRLTAEHVHR